VIGLDTNIVVRFLTQDDPIQSARATKLIEHVLTFENPGFISVVVMAEVAWVLKRPYAYSDRRTAEAIEALLRIDTLVIECEQQVFAAMTVLKEGRGSFTDALIAGLELQAGCSRTLTFDERASRLTGFALL
jgi:predicted nucleic-acid-binding protein